MSSSLNSNEKNVQLQSPFVTMNDYDEEVERIHRPDNATLTEPARPALLKADVSQFPGIHTGSGVQNINIGNGLQDNRQYNSQVVIHHGFERENHTRWIPSAVTTYGYENCKQNPMDLASRRKKRLIAATRKQGTVSRIVDL